MSRLFLCGLKPEIVNLVATGDLKQRVSLDHISELSHTIYDQEIYGGRVAYLKTPEMHGKVSIFPSGKLISIGTKSPVEAQRDLEATVKVLADSGLIEPVEVEARIRNIVVLLQVNVTGLEELAEAIGVIYEPDQFPAAIYKPDDLDVSYLIFNSGKIIISGIKSIEEIEVASKKIVETLKELDMIDE